MGGDRPGQPPNPETVAFREKFQKATKYVDFREMLAKQRDLDAVIIATPDHMHATVAAAAMRAGKHVYCRSRSRTRCTSRGCCARSRGEEAKVVTQMGNQGHSGDGTRRVVEWMRAGVIGPVREVHIYTDRPARYLGAGSSASRAPAPSHSRHSRNGNVGAVSNALAAIARQRERRRRPPGLRWDLYLGPIAEDIPYHPVYHPFTWRGWVDFGVRRARRHGRAPDRSGVLVARTHAADEHRSDVVALGDGDDSRARRARRRARARRRGTCRIRWRRRCTISSRPSAIVRR